MCKYCTDCVDFLVRDRIVIIVKDSETQWIMLKEHKLLLANMVDICKEADSAHTQGCAICLDVFNKVLPVRLQRLNKLKFTNS